MVTVPMSLPLHCHYLSHFSVFHKQLLSTVQGGATQLIIKAPAQSVHASSRFEHPVFHSTNHYDDPIDWDTMNYYHHWILLASATCWKVAPHLTILVPPTPCPTLSPTSLPSLPSLPSPRHLSSFANHLFPSIPVSMGRSTNSYAASETS
jgi:hypothetical protein